MQERYLLHGARFESHCHIDYPQDVRCFPQSPKANVGTMYKMRQLASLNIAFHSFFANNSPIVRYVISATENVLSKESVKCTLV
jgi:hypothetical protein